LLRHREIFPSDEGASLSVRAPAHRLDEFPAGYSLAGCSPVLGCSSRQGRQGTVRDNGATRPTGSRPSYALVLK
jgi:hypothetical protein